jgi:hypothetical protein
MSVDTLEPRMMFAATPAPTYYPIPTLHSNPGARHTLYLDFDGHSAENYGPNGLEGRVTAAAAAGGAALAAGFIATGGLSAAIASVASIVAGLFHQEWFPSPSTQSFDLTNTPGGYDKAETDAMRDIWARVAEDYSPFDTDVTTVLPAVFGDGDVRVSIGGDGAWWPFDAKGVGIPADWPGTTDHTAFVFSDKLDAGQGAAAGRVEKIANTASHEAGHSLGLYHQAGKDEMGNQTEYNWTGLQNGTRYKQPIMGGVSVGERGTWWSGPSTMEIFPVNRPMQKDLDFLTAKLGLAADRGGSEYTVLPLTYDPNAQALVGKGVIESASDRDCFRFHADGTGPVRITVNVARFLTGADKATFGGAGQLIANLATKLEVRDDNGHLVLDTDGRPVTFNSTLQAPQDPMLPAQRVDDTDEGLGVTATAVLPGGNYTVTVAAHDSGTTLSDGVKSNITYTNYGDLGQYAVSVKQLGGAHVSQVSYERLNSSGQEPFAINVRFDRPVTSFKARDVLLTNNPVAGTPQRIFLNDANVIPVAGSEGFLWKIQVASVPLGGYRMTLGTGVTDRFGERLGAVFTKTFSDNVRPTLVSAVVGTRSIVLTFDKAMDPATVALATVTDAQNTAIGFGAARATDWTRRVFEVPLASAPIGGFHLTLASSCEDLWNNPLVSPGVVSMTDSAGPKVNGITVLNNGMLRPGGNGVSAELLVVFNEPIDQTTFTFGDIRITDPSGAVVPVLGISPRSTLDTRPGQAFSVEVARPVFGGNYGIKIGPDIRDVSGNRMDQDQDGFVAQNELDRLARLRITPTMVQRMLINRELVEDLFSSTFVLQNVSVVR